MYTPNEHLGEVHCRLLQATLDEVNADAPANDHRAPAQYYESWQRLLPASSAPPIHVPSNSNATLSPPHEDWGFIDHVNGTRAAPEPWSSDQVSAETVNQSAQHRLPTPPPHHDGLRELLHRVTHSSPSDSQQDFPSLLYGLLPQTRQFFASGPNIVTINGSTIWKTDSIGEGLDEWTAYNPLYQTHYELPSPVWDHPPLGHAAAYQQQYVQPPVMQYAPPPQPSQACRALSITSPSTLLLHNGSTSWMPPIQQWRTDNLAVPARNKRRNPDASIRHKQETYRKKGEARRHTVAASIVEAQTLAHRPLPTPGPPRAKITVPIKRRKITPPEKATVSEVEQSTRHALTMTAYLSPYGGPMVEALMSNIPPAQIEEHHISTTELPPPTPDEFPQPIVSNYEDYKWSVFRYELLPLSGYDHAERWLEELLSTTLQSEFQRRHCSHTSNGFLKDGGRHSLLVLHNAANPFEHEPPAYSTITIGVYGYHWYMHNEIHWTTLGSDQRALLAQCVQAGLIEEKHKWTFDAAKAAEKRFHRAYWLAANRKDLKDLLNRGPSDDKPHDLIEEMGDGDPDKEFGISESEMKSSWDVTDAEAATAWQRVQDEVEALGDMCNDLDGWQHVVISSSER